MPPEGIEPPSTVPKTVALSVKLRGQEIQLPVRQSSTEARAPAEATGAFKLPLDYRFFAANCPESIKVRQRDSHGRIRECCLYLWPAAANKGRVQMIVSHPATS